MGVGERGGSFTPLHPFQLSALIYAIVCFDCDWCAFDILKEKETGEWVEGEWGGREKSTMWRLDPQAHCSPTV